jgi:hypothetical protein
MLMLKLIWWIWFSFFFAEALEPRHMTYAEHRSSPLHLLELMAAKAPKAFPI